MARPPARREAQAKMDMMMADRGGLVGRGASERWFGGRATATERLATEGDGVYLSRRAAERLGGNGRGLSEVARGRARPTAGSNRQARNSGMEREGGRLTRSRNLRPEIAKATRRLEPYPNRSMAVSVVLKGGEGSMEEERRRYRTGGGEEERKREKGETGKF